MSEPFVSLPWSFISPLFFQIVSVFVIFGLIYTPSTWLKRDFTFSFIAISVCVFVLSFLLHHVEFQLSLAIGLFAIFGIIRFRTDPIPIKEMTYLFVGIAVSLINALSFDFFFTNHVVASNIVIWVILAVTERLLYHRRPSTIDIVYDRLDLISPEKQDELIEDIKLRTGLKVVEVKISGVDMLKETATLVVYFL
ncbi:DUF4956 domain-containing protein [Halosquirtibacter laminarini]|uniref:DUF4956 domain-containing protein n=1 Tax=Halosquirtibacter laminarini TaxID=3374600 RepID=A0AC61NMH4_9BACT|nr:DUF4956 domain-containing protein [Prolixibacteraceae bacterium]